jgi:hypothetical protein
MPKRNSKNRSSTRRSAQKKNPRSPHYVDLGSRTVTSDWSMNAGRVAHMNDPREDNSVFNFVECTTQESSFSSSVTVPTGVGAYISLSGLPNASTYAALFDQYRICQVEVWAMPTGTLAPEESALFKSVVDYDNTTSTATTAFFDSYSNTHTTTLQNGHYRRFTPHIAIAAYAGAFTSYGNRSLQWIDCNSTGVQHYGVKYYIDTTSAVVPVDLIWRVWIQFRNKV